MDIVNLGAPQSLLSQLREKQSLLAKAKAEAGQVEQDLKTARDERSNRQRVLDLLLDDPEASAGDVAACAAEFQAAKAAEGALTGRQETLGVTIANLEIQTRSLKEQFKS